MRRKITVVGAGNVGATTAQRLAERDYADVVSRGHRRGDATGQGARPQPVRARGGLQAEHHRHERYEETGARTSW